MMAAGPGPGAGHRGASGSECPSVQDSSRRPDASNEPPDQPGGDSLSEARHELRTPLNQILGYSEMLIEDAQDAGQERLIPDLHNVHRAAKRLQELINVYLVPSGPDHPRSSTLSLHPSTSAPHQASEAKASRGTEAPAERLRGAGSHLLVVDDDEANRDMLRRRLERYGYKVTTAAGGQEALQELRARPFDLLLLDLIMPGLDGYEVLQQIKHDAELRHMPVLMISALDEMDSVIRCIEVGAEDYLPKPFNPTLLKARLEACLEKKRLRDQEQQIYRALVESQERLAAELGEAAEYVRSLLPGPLKGEIEADWRFVPSMELGGDAFGYHWLDDQHLAMFVLDVCGHGVGAALLSISVMNVLRSQALPEADFRDPARVLAGLNEAFPMENQNNMYFTLWYGVYHRSTRTFSYASGGHPPAVLVERSPGGPPRVTCLSTPGLAVGCMPGVAYRSAQCSVPPGSRLFVFSDGAYEIAGPNGSMPDLAAFATELGHTIDTPGRALDRLMAAAQAARGDAPFEDDYSIMQLDF
jgi:sigma-B regulation protein RsbU (phosphoserine phosphatase)